MRQTPFWVKIWGPVSTFIDTPAPAPLPPPSPLVPQPGGRGFSGYLDQNDLASGHSIAPGQVFGFSFPPGRMNIMILSGQVQLMSQDGSVTRGCSDQTFLVEFGQFVPRAPLVTACNESNAVLMALRPPPPPQPAHPIPSPQTGRSPDAMSQAAAAAERERQAREEQRRREDEARAERLRREEQAEQDELDRIASNKRLEDARRQAAEAKGCQYQGNGISVCPGKGF
jgi:hypothetical protein